MKEGKEKMKFAIKFCDIQNDLENLKNILNDAQSDIVEIFIIFDEVKKTFLTDTKKKEKYVNKCRKILQKLHFPFDHILLTDQDNFVELCERNHIDVVFLREKKEIEAFQDNKYMVAMDISNHEVFQLKLREYIEYWNSPLIPIEVMPSDSPSKDKIWRKYYTRKQAKDLERFLNEKKSMFAHIVDNNQDFLYSTAIEICDTDTKITYEELIQNVSIYKQAFLQDGIQQEDVVMIACPNVPASIYSFFALQEIGAIPSMVHIFTKKSLMHQYFVSEKCRAVVMIGMEEVYKNVKEAIKGTNVKRVISVPLTDSLSLKYKLGLHLVNSKLGKFIINLSKTKGKYKLERNSPYTKAVKNVTTQLFSDFQNTAGNFVLNEDEIFLSLEHFLQKKGKKDEACTPNEVAAYLHTGGTTGDPKAALLSQKNFNTSIDAFEATIQDYKRGETFISIPPLFHILGLNNCIYMPLRVGAKIVLVPKYNKKKLPDIFKKYHPEYFFGVPKIGQDMLANESGFSDVDMSCCKYIVFGGEEMQHKFLTQFQNFIKKLDASIQVSQSLGATEATCSMTNTFNNCNEIGSLGIPLIHLNAKIVKIKEPFEEDFETIEELGYNQVGEICFQGDSIMMGYLHEEDNETTLREHADGKTWLHTGDAGYITERGIIYFENRIKDMIKINGEQVFTSEIKKVITSHPLVEKCVITCITDEDNKKRIIATITTVDSSLLHADIEQQIIELCKNSLIKEAVPREIIVKEHLPETMYLKTDTNLLKKEYQERQKVKYIKK